MKLNFAELFLMLTVLRAVGCCTEELSHGVRLKGYTVETMPDIGFHSCIKECQLRHLHCQSVNYNTQYFLCEINHHDAENQTEEFVDDPDYIFTKVVNVSRV
jgi:hypothetical protein